MSLLAGTLHRGVSVPLLAETPTQGCYCVSLGRYTCTGMSTYLSWQVHCTGACLSLHGHLLADTPAQGCTVSLLADIPAQGCHCVSLSRYTCTGVYSVSLGRYTCTGVSLCLLAGTPAQGLPLLVDTLSKETVFIPLSVLSNTSRANTQMSCIIQRLLFRPKT